MTVAVNPKSLGVEEPFIPWTPAGEMAMRRLLAAIEAAGYSWQIVEHMRAWLLAKAQGNVNSVSRGSKWTYRNIIKELAVDPSPTKGGNGSRRSNGARKVDAALSKRGLDTRTRRVVLEVLADVAQSEPPISDLM